jgi:cytochrome c biogenesis protein CcmG/thiol:disulfide interchange protein DsbE
MEFPNWFWSLLAGALLMLALAGVSTAFQSDSAPQWATSELASDEAPDFSLKTLSGNTFRLKEHRGKVVVLNFWGTWCPPCREEIPMFVKLQRELGNEGLQFVGVALERSAGPKEVRAFTQKMDMNYPVGLGDGSIARKYGGVRGLPMTFIIGPDGIIQGHIPGMATESMLRPGLEKLLKKTSTDG